MRDRIAGEWTVFLLAVQFLTRLPVGAPDWTPERMEATPRWYPAVGLIVGALCALAFWLASLVFPPVVAVILSTGVGLLTTGAFHEDGFADCCDGLGGFVSRERALEIMKDSRLGTYGAAGLGLILATKIAALSALPPETVPWILIGAHGLSRASSVLVIATGTYVRDNGTGKPVASGTDGLGVAWAMAGAVAICLALSIPAFWAVGGLAGMVIGHVAMRRVFERRLHGYTGDCLGAVQQASEVGLYLGVLALAEWGA